MSGPRCTVCDHAERKKIDTALAVASVRDIAGRFGLSKSAVHAHKQNHVGPAVARAVATRTELSAQALVQRLADLLERCDRAMDKAEDGGDIKTLGGLIRESRELTVTIGRTVGLWTDKPQIVNDNRRQIAINLDMKSLDELLQLRGRLDGLDTKPALPTTTIESEIK